MEVVELRPALDCDDIAQGLRNIADDIEAGEYGFTPTLASIVLGRETEHRDRNGVGVSFEWKSHGLGRTSVFAAKGLLAAALTSFEGAG